MGQTQVKITGFDRFAQTQVVIIRDLSERQLERIAKETEVIIREKIQASITRANSTGNLENSFNAEKIFRGWGVGNINFLNSQAPYWAHVNFGSSVVGASHNHRVPQGAFNPGNPFPDSGSAGARWEAGAGPYSFIPTQPIAPLNYISKTLQELNLIVEKAIREVK